MIKSTKLFILHFFVFLYFNWNNNNQNCSSLSGSCCYSDDCRISRSGLSCIWIQSNYAISSILKNKLFGIFAKPLLIHSISPLLLNKSQKAGYTNLTQVFWYVTDVCHYGSLKNNILQNLNMAGQKLTTHRDNITYSWNNNSSASDRQFINFQADTKEMIFCKTYNFC